MGDFPEEKIVNLNKIDMDLVPSKILEKFNDAKNKKNRGDAACIDIFVEIVKISIIDHSSWFKENIDYFLDEALEIRYQFFNNSSYQPPVNFQAIIAFLEDYQKLLQNQKRNKEVASHLPNNISDLMASANEQTHVVKNMATSFRFLIAINCVAVFCALVSTIITHFHPKDPNILQNVLPISLGAAFIFGLSIFGGFKANNYVKTYNRRRKSDDSLIDSIISLFSENIQKKDEYLDTNRQLPMINDNTTAFKII